MAHPGGNKYGDNSDEPLTDGERRQIQRFTTDPLAFDEKFTFWLKHNVERIVTKASGLITRHYIPDNSGIHPPPPLGEDGQGGMLAWQASDHGSVLNGIWTGRWYDSDNEFTSWETLFMPLVLNTNFTGTHYGATAQSTIISGPLHFPAAGTWDLVGWIEARDDALSRAGTLQIQRDGVDILPYGGIHIEMGESTHIGATLGSAYPAPFGDFETATWDVTFESDDPAQGSELRISLMLFPSYLYPTKAATSAPANSVGPTLVPATDPDGTTDSVGCNPGTWAGTTPITYSFAWTTSPGFPTPFAAFPVDPGDVNTLTAPLSAYGLVAGDQIMCTVTATNDIGSTPADTNFVTVL